MEAKEHYKKAKEMLENLLGKFIETQVEYYKEYKDTGPSITSKEMVTAEKFIKTIRSKIQEIDKNLKALEQ